MRQDHLSNQALAIHVNLGSQLNTSLKNQDPSLAKCKFGWKIFGLILTLYIQPNTLPTEAGQQLKVA